MRKLIAFVFVSLDGYYKDQHNDMSWHEHGKEESRYSEEMLQQNNVLLFGKNTYELMAGFWPTKTAMENFPNVARGMNTAEKIVFSNSLITADWNNTQIIKGDIITEVKKIKETAGKNLALLGSGTILAQFTQANLIDEFEIMIDPIILGQGTSIFSSLTPARRLKMVKSIVLSSGSIINTYSNHN